MSTASLMRERRWVLGLGWGQRGVGAGWRGVCSGFGAECFGHEFDA